MAAIDRVGGDKFAKLNEYDRFWLSKQSSKPITHSTLEVIANRYLTQNQNTFANFYIHSLAFYLARFVFDIFKAFHFLKPMEKTQSHTESKRE